MHTLNVIFQIFVCAGSEFIIHGALKGLLLVSLQVKILVLVTEEPPTTICLHTFETQIFSMNYFVFIQFTLESKMLVTMTTLYRFL